MLNLIVMTSAQEREVYLLDFMKYTCNIGLHLDSCEPVCLKLSMMVYTLPSQFVSSLNNLDFAQGHMVMGKARTCAIILS